MQTLDSCGEEAFLPYETTAHSCTGPLIRDKTGKVVGMENDDTGVGLREYQLLRRLHRFHLACLCVRWRGLFLRAAGPFLFCAQQFRWILMRMSYKHSFSGKQELRCLSNMPGEERFRVLDLEPTRYSEGLWD